MIYLDNAATTGKKPETVIRAVGNALREYSSNPGRSGHTPSIKTSTAVYEVRKKVADFFGATGPECVVFTLNCTHSINAVIKGVLKRGDHVIISSLEHNAVLRPLVKVGVDYDIAKVSLTDDNRTLAEFERKIRPNTKLIICTGASNVIGKTLPIGLIGALCRQRNILFAVDAAQISGVFPIDMQKMNIDYLCIAPHKGLYAPMGIGILICEKPIENTIIEGGTGTNSIETKQPDYLPERLESGTVNVPSILGVGAGIDYVKQLGLDKIYNHEMNLCRTLYDELLKIDGVELYTPRPEFYVYAPVVSFNISGKNSTELSAFLNKNGIAVRSGLHCAPLAHKQIGTLDFGTVRVSVGTFNSQNDIKTLVNVVKKAQFV